MRFFSLCIHLLLLITTPALLATPPAAAVAKNQPKKLSKHFKKENRYHLATYDEILYLLEEIDSGRAEKNYRSKDLKRINNYLAYLAEKGMTPGLTETTSLQSDIACLLHTSPSYYDTCFIDNLDIIAAKGWFSSGWKNTKKFTKKHKKAIIIGAVIVVATAAIVITVGAASPGAASAVAGAAGAGASSISSDQLQATSTEPKFDCNVTEQVDAFKETLATHNILEPTTLDSLSLEETGRVLGPIFAHDILTQINLPTYSSTEIDTNFSTSYTPLLPSQVSLPETTHTLLGEKAYECGYFTQAVEEYGKALELNPSTSHLYLDRSAAYFSLGEYDYALEDFKEYINQAPPTQAFSLSDFSKGFAKGLPKGIYDSGEGLLFFLSDCVIHPIQTCEQMWDALTLLSDLAKTNEWGTIGEALAPEIHELVTQWDTIPSDQRGELAGYALGKYGADLIIPAATAKIASKGLKGAKELSTVSRSIKSAEKTLLLETSASLESGAKIAEIAKLERRLSDWLGKGSRCIKNEAGDLVFLSQDGLRCVRFDFHRTKPHHNPHGHVEIKVGGKWIKSGPIYPSDVPHN
ncbi:MAG: hypothetical protein P0S96_01475 [Simkaniaceae bacterium]|nr:hypothetical protein [Candidatus Sacchlamyda saccharinae]